MNYLWNDETNARRRRHGARVEARDHLVHPLPRRAQTPEACRRPVAVAHAVALYRTIMRAIVLQMVVGSAPTLWGQCMNEAIAQHPTEPGRLGSPALAALPVDAVPVDADGRCRVWLQVEPALAASFVANRLPAALRSMLSTRDIELEGSLGDILQLHLPASEIGRLEQIPGALQVLSPMRAWVPPAGASSGRCDGPPVVSEGLGDMRVPAFHELGYDGSGIRIGIVDVGFARAAECIGNELPTDTEIRYFGGADPNTSETHGTACAEIVHDVAPGAKLYLAGVATAVDLQLALEWLLEERVEVISHSLAWFLGGGDGSGPICDLVAGVHARGVTFVTASGNFAEKHWRGMARDTDGDSLIEVVGSREHVLLGSSSSSVRLVLLWDRWPTSPDLSFDLEILDGENVVASSESLYTQSPYAYREVDAGRPVGDGRFRIRLQEGDLANVTLRVFRIDNAGLIDREDRVSAGSLTVPADSPFALSVGAFSWRDQRLEDFSSYGPTVSGLPKPELVGPDQVGTSVADNFVGTSASCPHVAGAVALLLSAKVQGGLNEMHWSDDDVRTLLESAAVPLRDDRFGAMGWGRVRLPLRSTPSTASPLETRGVGREAQIWLRRDADEPAGALRLYNAQGRLVASLSGSSEDESWTRYRVRDSVPPLRTGRYWAVAPSGRAQTPLLWLAE